MAIDVKGELSSQLDWYWEAMFRPRLAGLTDEEYLWEPAPGCWTVRRRDDGRWVPDVGPEPDPAPFTTIAWRMCHIGSLLVARANFHFGDRSYLRSSVDWPGTAAAAVEFVEKGYDAWRTGLDALEPEKLHAVSEGPPGTLDSQFPFAAVVLHVNREVIHHGAEVATLRDLYVAMNQDPLVAACLRGDTEAVELITKSDRSSVDRARTAEPAAILRAAHLRNVDAIRQLAALGFDLNAMTSRAALHVAAGDGNIEMVDVLLDLGADTSLTDTSYGATPRGWAEYFGRAEMVEHLESRGVSQ